jgi:hypothetical protein
LLCQVRVKTDRIRVRVRVRIKVMVSVSVRVRVRVRVRATKCFSSILLYTKDVKKMHVKITYLPHETVA